MKTIPLTQGKFALVDDEDFGTASRFKWKLAKRKRSFYAECVMFMGRLGGRKEGKKQSCSMFLHQLLMRPPKGLMVDHRDCDGLNCQRENMRLCTSSQNSQNRRRQLRTKSRFKGVWPEHRVGVWKAQIYYDKHLIYLGRFFSEDEAALAYDNAALKYFGEFAHLNFPQQKRTA